LSISVLENQLFAPTLKGVIDFLRSPWGRGKRRKSMRAHALFQILILYLKHSSLLNLKNISIFVKLKFKSIYKIIYEKITITG